jgi:hypothetical protein
MQQKSETRAKQPTRRAGAPAQKPRENAQEVIRDFFAALARVHGAPAPAAQEKP